METPAELICPECGTLSIDPSPGDGGSGPAAGPETATCRHCGRRYDVAVLPTFEQRHATLIEAAARETCPSCGVGPRVVRSLCDRTARQCFFVVACEGCGDVRLA